jgi:hypothetical protein
MHKAPEKCFQVTLVLGVVTLPQKLEKALIKSSEARIFSNYSRAQSVNNAKDGKAITRAT